MEFSKLPTSTNFITNREHRWGLDAQHQFLKNQLHVLCKHCLSVDCVCQPVFCDSSFLSPVQPSLCLCMSVCVCVARSKCLTRFPSFLDQLKLLCVLPHGRLFTICTMQLLSYKHSAVVQTFKIAFRKMKWQPYGYTYKIENKD